MRTDDHRDWRLSLGAYALGDLPAEFKVPHMGWNQLQFRAASPLVAGLDSGVHCYFVHSYYPVPKDATVIAAEADYPTPFAAAVWYQNIQATQFHPEKSQRVGLRMLKNFAEMRTISNGS